MGRLRSVVVALLLVVASASSAAAAVQVERDPDVDLASFRTFSVKVGTPWGSPICETRVAHAVSDVLVAKGLAPVDEPSADLLVVLHGSTKEKQHLTSFYTGWAGWGWRHRWGYVAPTYFLHEYTERTLVVDMFEAKTKQVVWRGTASGIASASFERIHRRLEKALEKMFRDFP
jgi:hypothetical protein